MFFFFTFQQMYIYRCYTLFVDTSLREVVCKTTTYNDSCMVNVSIKGSYHANQRNPTQKSFQ